MNHLCGQCKQKLKADHCEVRAARSSSHLDALDFPSSAAKAPLAHPAPCPCTPSGMPNGHCCSSCRPGATQHDPCRVPVQDATGTAGVHCCGTAGGEARAAVFYHGPDSNAMAGLLGSCASQGVLCCILPQAKALDAASIVLQPVASALPAAQHCATSTSTAATANTHNSSSSSSGRHEGAAAAALSQFDGQRFMSHLSSSSMGHVLLTAADINSTQQFLQQHSAAFGPGCVMVADRQSSGKGEQPHR